MKIKKKLQSKKLYVKIVIWKSIVLKSWFNLMWKKICNVFKFNEKLYVWE